MAAWLTVTVELGMETSTERESSTYAYGVLCRRCKKPLICGHVELRTGANVEDLRAAKGCLQATGQYVTCAAFDPNGEVCGESTFVALSTVLLIR